ncbi:MULTISPECIES: YbfB/YjiJ family MFS transporter [unclassified Paenibacillus]|uniref:YbfB/YjiJ family MFS transporter n=1 Tax=unclassified Paenibacillus TaxID=185978 RepID=UPI001AE9631E|nr:MULTISPECIES: YbfB/YjiJ family MFS transporter [unclassified Paenibacillus]MBP1156372.1 MFS family permease [Paenibacillus sp. PvP091]MBP1168242.1 MFS family permease [Paenibacillus sp. PvR098]MBP2439270.1 MFS family permease [Paenibacillus sp. PvP052]
MNALAQRPVFLLISGVLALFIAMGVGRFAYTPILPYMLERQYFGDAGAGALASANYAGYLAGAVMAAWFSGSGRRLVWLKLALVVSVLTTAMMGLTTHYPLWLTLRFVSGLAGAAVFVYASGVVLDGLAGLRGFGSASGLFYGGVGAGIAASGLVVPLLEASFGWQGTWLGLALICAGLLSAAWLGLKEYGERSPVQLAFKPSGNDLPRLDLRMLRLQLVYGLEGLGYIVTGTFLVAYAESVPAMKELSSWSWVLVGAAAVPSCWMWSKLQGFWGHERTLCFSMLLQAIGILLPVVFPTVAGLTAGAILFGATFMGITALAVSLARRLAVRDAGRSVGLVTAIYGAGQMAGPTAAGLLATLTGSYRWSLTGAATIVLIGACIIIIPIHAKGRSTCPM